VLNLEAMAFQQDISGQSFSPDPSSRSQKGLGSILTQSLPTQYRWTACKLSCTWLISICCLYYQPAYWEPTRERIRSQQGPTVGVKQTPLGMSTTTTDEQCIRRVCMTQRRRRDCWNTSRIFMNKIRDMVTGDSYRDKTKL